MVLSLVLQLSCLKHMAYQLTSGDSDLHLCGFCQGGGGQEQHLRRQFVLRAALSGTTMLWLVMEISLRFAILAVVAFGDSKQIWLWSCQHFMPHVKPVPHSKKVLGPICVCVAGLTPVSLKAAAPAAAMAASIAA